MSFGDVIIFHTNSIEGKLIKLFTGKFYNHSALMVEDNTARDISRNGVEDYYLDTFDGNYDAYVILSHVKMNERRRNQLKEFDEELIAEYSNKSILAMALRYLTSKERDNLPLIEDSKLNCSTRIALLYHKTNLPILDNIHYTQIMPSDFLESPYFNVDRRWSR